MNSNPYPALRRPSGGSPRASSRPPRRHSSNYRSFCIFHFPSRFFQASDFCLLVSPFSAPFLFNHLQTPDLQTPCFQLNANCPRVYPYPLPRHTLRSFLLSELCPLCVKNSTASRPSNPFRINTCKSVSKQSTLTPFRMNT